MRVTEAILEWMFPRRCPVCDGLVRNGIQGALICRECEGAFQKLRTPYDQGRALYQYESVRQSLYRFKYQGREEYKTYYGREMAREFGAYIERIKPDALLPVPIHKSRFKKRGYNQAESLALSLAAALEAGVSKDFAPRKIPVLTDYLQRVKQTDPLKLQNLSERKNNLKKAFIVARNDVKLNQTILIDDIYTTGATIAEITALLHEKGVGQVYFLTLAGDLHRL